MSDRRARDRVATSLLGTIMLGESVTTCLVRDFSPEGARLWIAGGLDLPKTFGLRIERHDMTRQADLRWQSEEEYGVAFRSNEVVRLQAPPVRRASYPEEYESRAAAERGEVQGEWGPIRNTAPRRRLHAFG